MAKHHRGNRLFFYYSDAYHLPPQECRKIKGFSVFCLFYRGKEKGWRRSGCTERFISLHCTIWKTLLGFVWDPLTEADWLLYWRLYSPLLKPEFWLVSKGGFEEFVGVDANAG